MLAITPVKAPFALSTTRVTRPCKRGQSLTVRAANWQKACNKKELAENEGRKVVELGGQRILVAEADGEVYAVSNKCSHLGLPLVGKTALLQGKVVNKCIVCPAHNTAFDLATGEVKGEWCPGFPDLPFVGKMSQSKPLPTFESRVNDDGTIEVKV